MEAKTITDITIENMLENIFTTYAIKKKRKEILDFYRKQINPDLFGNASAEATVADDEIAKQVDDVLKEDKRSANPYLSYANGKYYKTRRKAKPIKPIDMPDSNYIGRAGECAVMAELLFQGYNVNHMMVDEGIDLVASKANVFYYIQVKTKSVDQQNKVNFQIKQERFNSFIGTQIRYILVARCKLNNEIRNVYFTFNSTDIEKFLFQGVIPVPSDGNNSLSIKIEFDERTAKAFMYDGKNRENITFHMNNFNL